MTHTKDGKIWIAILSILFPVLLFLMNRYLPDVLPFSALYTGGTLWSWFTNGFFVAWLMVFVTLVLSDLVTQKFIERKAWEELDWRRFRRYMIFAAFYGVAKNFLYGWLELGIDVGSVSFWKVAAPVASLIPAVYFGLRKHRLITVEKKEPVFSLKRVALVVGVTALVIGGLRFTYGMRVEVWGSVSTHAARLGVDQFVWMPVFHVLHFLYAGLVSRWGLNGAWHAMTKKIGLALVATWSLWLPLQTTHALFYEMGWLPAEVRFFYMAIWLLPWHVFLNHMAFSQGTASRRLLKTIHAKKDVIHRSPEVDEARRSFLKWLGVAAAVVNSVVIAKWWEGILNVFRRSFHVESLHPADALVETEKVSGIAREAWVGGRWTMGMPGLAPVSAEIPSVNYQVLEKAGVLPDAFVGTNESQTKYLENKPTVYVKKFSISDKLAGMDSVKLLLHGLDTFARIQLNGWVIGETDNMYAPWEYDVKDFLKPEENTLEIFFASPVKVLREVESQHGRLFAVLDTSRVYGRKAQYSFGWDWGPRLPVSGPWKGIQVLGFNSHRIEDVGIQAQLSEGFSKGLLKGTVDVDSPVAEEVTLRVRVDVRGGPLEYRRFTRRVEKGKNLLKFDFPVDRPKLWWPRGYGKQYLYKVGVEIVSAEKKKVVDEKISFFGFRHVELVQKPDAQGETFFFKVNGEPIYIKGANWIPADSYLPRATPEAYRSLLQKMADGNMNMVRVWGGGIYESDDFYNAADELGLLVWQDFMFSYAQYPTEKWFMDSVRREAEANVRRLRNHPSLAIWCGNNEAQLAFHNHALVSREGWLNDIRFREKAIYEELLPEIVGRLDPKRPYWPGSPYGGKNPNDPDVGDRHNWEDFTRYDEDMGRFLSEFGIQAPPNEETLRYMAPSDEDRRLGSTVMDQHDKWVGKDSLVKVGTEFFGRPPRNFDEFVGWSQLVQGASLAKGLEHWSRRWKERGTGGVLIWQCNDCWPVISWSLIDYLGHPKPAYYFVKRAFSRLNVTLKANDDFVEIWAHNAGPKPIMGTLHWEAFDQDGNPLRQGMREITADANTADCIEKVFITVGDNPAYLRVRLLVNGQVVARNVHFQEAWSKVHKSIEQRKPHLTLKLEKGARAKRWRLRIQSDSLVPGVVFSGFPAKWDDNALVLTPGESVSVEFETADKLSASDIQKRLGARALLGNQPRVVKLFSRTLLLRDQK